MIAGRDVIVLSVDDARKLRDAIRLNGWDRMALKRLQKLDLLSAVTALDDAIRSADRV